MSSFVQRQLWQIEFVSTTELNLPLLGVQVLQHRLIHLLECRCLFLSSLMTVAGLTCNTRAVSRIPTVPIALLAFICRAEPRRRGVRGGPAPGGGGASGAA